MPAAEAQVVDLEEFATNTPEHLKAAWRRGRPLVVAAGRRRRMLIATVADLEDVHDALTNPTCPSPS